MSSLPLPSFEVQYVKSSMLGKRPKRERDGPKPIPKNRNQNLELKSYRALQDTVRVSGLYASDLTEA